MDMTIRTGLKRFLLIDRILRVDAGAIEGVRGFFCADLNSTPFC